jgi:DNA (cytosine-5)-methyltransferase 1
VYQWRRNYLRINKKGVSPTLMANMGTGGHNIPIVKDHKGFRKFTLRECLRLQGFPEEFEFPKEIKKSEAYKQIGNSVSVPVVARVAERLVKTL